MVVTHRGPASESTATDGPAVELKDVIRIYREGNVETRALRGVDLSVASGDYVALMGRSGSGKSTLLHLIAGMDRPTGGRVIVDGVDLSLVDETRRDTIRGARVGLIFQRENLPDFLNLEESVVLACALAGRAVDVRTAREVLSRVGLAGRLRHRPRQLSGGEQQRAAVAMILATRPRILLADEITGELDSANADGLLDLLADMHEREKLTIIAATHDRRVAVRAKRVVELRDGRVVDERAAQ